MFKNLIGASGALLLLIWLAKVAKTTSVLIGVWFPVFGVILALIWFFLTAQERVASRAQPQMLGLEELELLKKAMRDKRAANAAATGTAVERTPPQV